MTIIESIKKVLSEESRSLTHDAIYSKIIKNSYYKFGAKDPKSVVRSKLRRHCFGLNFPSASPIKHFSIDKVVNGKSYYTLWDNSFIGEIAAHKSDSELPEEIIDVNHTLHIEYVTNQLLECLKNSDPKFFENLVVDLLLQMGYGWNDDSSGVVNGGAGDGGIDGIIHEDKLKLESIYIQAKRKKSNKVTPTELRDFVGAMDIKKARKGVFITSTDFTKQAIKHADDSSMNITLINGETLCELLIEKNMGVSVVAMYPIYSVDNNYFNED